MMRIMEMISDSNIGGAGMWILNYADGYSKEKFELCVVLPKGAALAPLLRKKGCEVRECEMTPDCSLDRASIGVLKKEIAAWMPDVVHTHGSLAGRIAAKLSHKYTIYTKHTLSETTKGLKKTLRGLLDNALADKIIACSLCAKNNLMENGVRENKIAVVYNGTAPAVEMSPEERGEKRKDFGLGADEIVFSIVARLAPIKDHQTFLKGAAKAELPNARYLIVGGGECEAELKKQAEKLGIEKQCVFTGQLPGAAQIYPLIDVNVLTSLSENMPISLVESMAAGKPSIATRVGGMEEVAVNGETALLFEAGDADTLAKHMRRLYEDPQLRKELGEAGKARYEKNFTLEICVGETEKIYASAGGHQHGK